MGMTKHYCDRCYQEVQPMELSRILIERPSKELKYEYERWNKAVYCPDCMGKLLDILREWGNMRNEAGD